MRPDCRYRIRKGCTVLNAQSVDRIRIVTAPDLRSVIEHTGVKPSAATAAALDHDIREIPIHSLEEVIQTEYIIIHHRPLLPGSCGVYIEYGAVEVPFYVFNIR